jgi:hypothetical protein
MKAKTKEYYKVYVPKDKRITLTGFEPPKKYGLLRRIKWHLWDSI